MEAAMEDAFVEWVHTDIEALFFYISKHCILD